MVAVFTFFYMYMCYDHVLEGIICNMNWYDDFYVRKLKDLALILISCLNELMLCDVMCIVFYITFLNRRGDDFICVCVMIILGFVVVYMANYEEYPYSITSTHMNPIWMCDQTKVGVLYSIVEYVLASYDVMWVCLVYSPQ